MKLIRHDLSTKKIVIYYLNDYISKNSGFPPDDFSKKIVALKKNDQSAINYFYDLLEPKITVGQKFMVCYVPSSKSYKKWTGCREIACKVRQNKKLKMGEHILFRRLLLPQQKNFRSNVKTHYESFDLEKSFSHEIENQHILLFDDIITTGNTFLGCARFLLDNGAKKITGLILGSTKKWLPK